MACTVSHMEIGVRDLRNRTAEIIEVGTPRYRMLYDYLCNYGER